MRYLHVDVFAPRQYGGNSLAVFPEADGLLPEQMLTITRELRHFESVFLQRSSRGGDYRARVFDLFTELPFAGHPLIGAAAVLHDAAGEPSARRWTFELAAKTVDISTRRSGSGYYGLLDQGLAEFLGPCGRSEEVAPRFGLEASDLALDLPLEVVSTGLAYLVVPVRPAGLERASVRADLTPVLRKLGADFAVLLSDNGPEIRHWNNDGHIEDAATGSAAGVVGAYRLRHGLARSGEVFALHQGRFIGRASVLDVKPEQEPTGIRVHVGGSVSMVGRGVLEVLP
jgi:PhzF family phenazine biosynthesis protein